MRRALTYLGLTLLTCTVAIPLAVAAERRADGESSLLLHSLGFEGQSWPAGAEQGGEDRISVLVELVPRAQDDLKAASARLQVRSFAESVGGFVRHEYDLVPDLVNLRDIPRLRLQDLKRIPGVVRIEEDPRVRAHLHRSIPLIRGLTENQLIPAGISATGEGVRICVVDTGIDPDHLMVDGRVDTAAGWDFVDNDADPQDPDGHGSHVSGIALGRTGVQLPDVCGENLTFQGVAPEATLIGARVLDPTGAGFASDVIAGIDHCAAADLPGGPADVINLSLGFGLFTSACDSFSVSIAANNAVDAGVVVVASASNDGATNSLAAPACASKVISVGATYSTAFPSCEFPDISSFTWCLEESGAECTSDCTDTNPAADDLVCFSNKSGNLDVVAPGCVVFSADPESTTSVIGSCGTSQAAPHVTGLAALILDQNPFLSPAEVRQFIRDGAVDLGTPGFDTSFGHGRIDVINSLQLAEPDPCEIDEDCDDGVFCNGEELCVGNFCELGTPPVCDDQVDCTDDRCDAATDACVFEPVNVRCSDGNFCTGEEICHPTAGCLPGEPETCDDDIDCTVDECLPTAGCRNTPDFNRCQDGNVCNGFEDCNIVLGCLPGDPLFNGFPCDDGDVCTDEDACLNAECVGGIALPDFDEDTFCDLIDVCPAVPDPEQLNSDTDAYGDACDCAPQNGDFWELPGSVDGLILAHTGGPGGQTLLEWLAPLELGGIGVGYDTLRSTDAMDFESPSGECAETDGPDTQSIDLVTPGGNELLYFLIRARNDCGNGALRDATSGPRTALSCP